jgi:hypothetical protein
MSDGLIPSPAETPDEDAPESGNSKAQDQPAGDEKPKRPKAARRRAPEMPDLAELLEQLQRASGLVTLGILTPAKANVVVRCITKSIDVVMRSQTASPEASNQLAVVEACRENPQLVALLEGLLTDDQLSELLRQTGNDAA